MAFTLAFVAVLGTVLPGVLGKALIPDLNHFASKDNTYRFQANTLVHRMPKEEIGNLRRQYPFASMTD
jgi:hypothetical protein